MSIKKLATIPLSEWKSLVNFIKMNRIPVQRSADVLFPQVSKGIIKLPKKNMDGPSGFYSLAHEVGHVRTMKPEDYKLIDSVKINKTEANNVIHPNAAKPALFNKLLNLENKADDWAHMYLTSRGFRIPTVDKKAIRVNALRNMNTYRNTYPFALLPISEQNNFRAHMGKLMEDKIDAVFRISSEIEHPIAKGRMFEKLFNTDSTYNTTSKLIKNIRKKQLPNALVPTKFEKGF